MKKNGWFVLYHKYSTKKGLDKVALGKFSKDCKILASAGVRYIILEDFPEGLHYGAYDRVWSKETLKGMVEAADRWDMKIFPYFNPIEVSVKVLKKHPDWALLQDGKRHHAFSTWPRIYKEYYWRGIPMSTDVVCPATGWSGSLLTQVEELLYTYDFGGIYLDQVKWAFNCDRHSYGENASALVNLVEDMSELTRRKIKNGKVIINDYFISRPPAAALQDIVTPDRKIDIIKTDYKVLGKKILKNADIVLTENDPFWSLKKTSEVVRRIRKEFPGVQVFFFCHWDDCKGLANLKPTYKVVEKTGANICYFFPFPLAECLEDTKEVIDKFL